MPKCAVWSCKNSSNNIRIRDGVSFFHYPRDPLLASQWWSVLAPAVSDTFKPSTAVVCSDHFHDDHKYMCKKRHRLTRNAVPNLQLLGPAAYPQQPNRTVPQYDDLLSSDDETNMIVDIPEFLRPPSESTVCRVCLITEGRMKRVTEGNYEDAYQQVTGIKWNKKDQLPQHICWECGRRLQSAAIFKQRALAAHELLHALRTEHTCLTLNDVKLIDRKDHQLVSNLTLKRFPPNQYLSHTTINNNKIFSPILRSRLTSGPKKDTEETDNTGTGGKECTKDCVEEINVNTDKDKDRAIKVNIEDASSAEVEVNHEFDDVKNNAKDINLAPYKNLEGMDKSLIDTYRNSNDKGDTATDICKNNHSNADNYYNINVKIKCEPIYKNLDVKTENDYDYTNLNTDDSKDGCKDAESKHISNLTTNVKSEADIETDFNEIESTDMAPKGNDLDNVKIVVKDEIDNYDSDESDILVIDAGNDTNNEPLETVIKSAYVGAQDGGMLIDELIDIYNNDGDGDERLQELNDRFGDEATVEIEQGWGIKRIDGYTQETAAGKSRPTLNKPGDVLTASSIRSRAYQKLNKALFTLTPVSEAEQIADIFKRQDTPRFKRATHKCLLCFRSFKLRKAYETHMLRHDASNGAFECPVCKARQKSPRAVRTHMHGQHRVKISCKECNFVTMNRSVARSHEKWHAGTVYQCPHCPSQFDQESTYNCHLRTRHVHAFACAICGFTFVSRKGLAVHRVKRHAAADQIPLLGPHCEACELRFASEEAYTRHLKRSSRHRPNNSQSIPGEAVN